MTPADRARVTELLGREPRGSFEIVVRTPEGDPVVIRNAPLLDDGTPMPTRYWLVGPGEVRRIGRLEAAGGVGRAEAEIDAGELAAAHRRYAAERDAEIPSNHNGPRPYGGVGGTRQGIKCLHAHWAWHLAGGDDPVGRWIEHELTTPGRTDHPSVTIADDSTTVELDDGTAVIAWGPSNLTARWLCDGDPPPPEALTNALGAIDDHLDDVEREHPGVAMIDRLTFRGSAAVHLAQLETGRAELPPHIDVRRVDAEDVFRLVATQPLAERAHHPGLASDGVTTIVATCIIVLAFMRRFDLDVVHLDTSVPRPAVDAV